MPHPSLAELAHRPWELPQNAWTWRQTWQDLLFAHFPVEVRRIRHLVPSSLTIQEFDGSSWIGVVPFRMTGVMRRPLPDMPWISAFPELNVRLYVERDGRPGVWFLSLDATNPLAVWAAKQFFHLPYVHAGMSLVEDDRGIAFTSRRHRGEPAVVEARYRPTSDPYASTPGSLEHFLTERYCLYAESRSKELFRAEVHHVKWPLQRAEAEIDAAAILAVHGLSADGPPATLHFSRRLDVVVWSPERIARE